MISFSVGPLAVPVAPLLLLVSLWVAARLVRRLAPVEVAARADNVRISAINLWASWCPPCRAEMPTLAQAQQRTPGIRFLFINEGEMREVVTLYLMREGLDVDDVWMDPGSTLGLAVGSSGLPTTLFFNAQGELLDAHFGIINAAVLQAKLQDLIER